MDAEGSNESKPASTGDVITQQELATHLIFQNVEYPQRASLLQRFQDGARIEPGPLTIVQPYFDLGPFIVPSSESVLRADRIRLCIHNAKLALDEIDRGSAATQFSRATQELTARVWEIVLERRAASLGARNWNGFRNRVRDAVYACEITWMLWVATKCVTYGFTWLSAQMFGVASARASDLVCVIPSA